VAGVVFHELLRVSLRERDIIRFGTGMADSFYFDDYYRDYFCDYPDNYPKGKERSISEKMGRYKPRLITLWLGLAKLPRKLLKPRPANIDLVVAVIFGQVLPFHTTARA